MAQYQPLLNLVICHEYYQGGIPSQHIDYKIHESSMRLMKNLGLLSHLADSEVAFFYDGVAEQREKITNYLSYCKQNHRAEKTLTLLVKITDTAFYYCTAINASPAEGIFYFEDTELLQKPSTDGNTCIYKKAYISRKDSRVVNLLSDTTRIRGQDTVIIKVDLCYWLHKALFDESENEQKTLYLNFASQHYYWLYSIFVGERLYNEVTSNNQDDLLFIETVPAKNLSAAHTLESQDATISFTRMNGVQKIGNPFVIHFISKQTIRCVNRQAFKVRLKKRNGVTVKTLMESLPHPQYSHQEKLTMDGKATTVLSVHMKL
ncbi:hypothetical protein [Spartinivicinus poritis]|uniref:Uncharacterized protein n=1 Tax=Spartinivicinus poritis TaxID=2994640 RepID=A0ABT5U648_9GAMM|nr:hypothetical protein [Spartinivicinus sp. A2-2]MDE1460664.1 hypothetical protein [Spartinivicinus sp. A2-2]